MNEIIKILNEFNSRSIKPTKITFDHPNHNIKLEFHYQINPDQPVFKLIFDLPIVQIDYQAIANLNHHYLRLINQNHINSTINLQADIIKILSDIQLHLKDSDLNRNELIISVENNQIKFENLSNKKSYQIFIPALKNNYQQDLINASDVIKERSLSDLQANVDQTLEFEIEDEKTQVFLDANPIIKTQLRKIVQRLEKQKLIQGFHTCLLYTSDAADECCGV